MNLPIMIGPDVYCRADSKLLLAYEDQRLYIGYTPDGDQPGRSCAVLISALAGETPVPYTCAIQDNKVVLRADAGYLAFAISASGVLLVSGKGLGMRISNGKAKNTFMGGGNAVADARGGCLFAIAGVKFRFLPRAGSAKPESRWDFNYLCDPDPRLFLFPDEAGRLELAVFASENEENVTDDGEAVDAAAEKLLADFVAFCDTMGIDPDQNTAMRAAWTLWNCRQPQRRAYELDLTLAPVYIRGRQSSGSLFMEDYALYALVHSDPQQALQLLFRPFAAMQPDGFIPAVLSGRKLLFTCTPPLFGLVLKCRDDIAGLAGAREYALLKTAFGWWQQKRYSGQYGLFYYVHRTENGRKKPVPFIGLAPVMAPDLNTYMLLWAEQMQQLAVGLGLHDDAAAWERLGRSVSDGLETHLRGTDGYRRMDLSGRKAPKDYAGDLLPAILGRAVRDLPSPDQAGEFLAMRGHTASGKALAEVVISSYQAHSIPDIRTAVTCLLASRVLSEGR